MNELDAAAIQDRMARMGLQSPLSQGDQKAITRLAEKIQRLQRLTTPQQFQLLTATLRLHKDKLEPKVDAILAEIEVGTFYKDLGTPEAPPVEITTYSNRRQRRRDRLDHK